MTQLALDYRHCAEQRPLYLKHAEVEQLANRVREQLVAETVDAIPLDQLSAVSRLTINGVSFELCIGTDEPVHDEQGAPVLGICEYDPGMPGTAMVSVAPVSAETSAELVRSTLAHELGHALFDAPAWIVAAARGPGLFDDLVEAGHKAYRTTTPDAAHLARQPPQPDRGGNAGVAPADRLPQHVYFAELRANEFMGSLLVPRARLTQAVEELAPRCGVAIHRRPTLIPGVPGLIETLTAEADFASVRLTALLAALAERFTVHPRFIQVRLQHYGLPVL